MALWNYVREEAETNKRISGLLKKTAAAVVFLLMLSLFGVTSFGDYYSGDRPWSDAEKTVTCLGAADNIDPGVNPSRVLFSTLIRGEEGQPNAEYKYTISDNEITAGISDNHVITKSGSGSILCVPYKIRGAHVANINRLSVFVTDKEYYEEGARILQYGALFIDPEKEYYYQGTGYLTFESEDTWGNDYHIYLIAEDINGDGENDYASIPCELKPIHQHRFNYSAVGNKITATCDVEGRCNLKDKKISLEIVVGVDNNTFKYSKGVRRGAEINGRSIYNFNNATGLSVSSDQIRYMKE